MRLNVGAGPHYAEGWVNTDLVENEHVHPDRIVTAGDPFPFAPATFDRAYCGHVLEHVPWDDLPAWLDELALCLTDDAEVMFVGPDTFRVLDRWKAGDEEWAKVAGVIEGPGAYLEHLGERTSYRWGGDRHAWNCHEQRVAMLLEECGWRDVTAWPVLDNGRLDEQRIRDAGWPLVAGEPCQFAVSATRPERC